MNIEHFERKIVMKIAIKGINAGGLCILILTLVGVSVAQERTEAQLEVWQVVEDYTEASHQRNLKGYLSHWHPDFVGWHNGDSLPTSRQEREKGLAYYFENAKSVEYSLEPLTVLVVADGTAAIVHYKLRNVLESTASGKRSSGLSFWTDYLVKENGRWLLISDHGGSVPEAWTAKK
jgi:ketosteroid isomerase-like protein